MDNSFQCTDLFILHLKTERGLSPNTIESYSRDLLNLSVYLADRKKDIKSVTRDDLHNFIVTLYDLGLNPRSIARTISTIKVFFSFLTGENIISDDPSFNIKAPKFVKTLPEVLSIEEVERMFSAAAGMGTWEGVRDLAILELMYASGLRVSEVCMLKREDLNLDDGFIVVRKGKGSKDRLTLIGESAKKRIMEYIERSRERLLVSPYLFLTRRNKYFTR
jgi:integrase/recombinase XerD